LYRAALDGTICVVMAAVKGRDATARLGPVILSSPYPVDECVRRLAAVTTMRSATSWYLDPRTVGLPEPRFRGEVSPSRILVARCAGRDGFAPMLDARLEPSADGGTRLTGTTGLRPSVRTFRRVFAGVCGLIAVASLAGGIHLLVSGHLAGLGPAVLVPLLMAALAGSHEVACRRLPARQSGVLIADISEILGSPVTDASRRQ
jgi:hypothetical protein